jgi:hypothetical protein
LKRSLPQDLFSREPVRHPRFPTRCLGPWASQKATAGGCATRVLENPDSVAEGCLAEEACPAHRPVKESKLPFLGAWRVGAPFRCDARRKTNSLGEL